MHVAAIHLNHTYNGCKHTLLRDIIPSEILCTGFIERLVEVVSEEKESYDFRCKKELVSFFTNLRDKYLFEYINLNSSENAIHMPEGLLISYLFKNRIYKS